MIASAEHCCTGTMPYYAVARGHRPGVYTSWDDAKEQVERFPNARHKKFPTRAQAEKFLVSNGAVVSVDGNESRSPPEGHSATQPRVQTSQQPPPFQNFVSSASSSPKRASGANNNAWSSPPPRLIYYYAVAKGRVPAVYDNWAEAEMQVKDLFSARYRRFSTLEEAHDFVDDFKRSQEADPSDPDPKNPSALVAFCDGSSVKNGQLGCRAGWACVFPHNSAWDVAGNVPGWRQTNNRAEYVAAIKAILRANTEDPRQTKPLYIFSDSMLLIRSMTEWVSAWRDAGWVKADGKPVMNVDLLKRLVEEQGGRRILWRHVKAHTNRTDWRSIWNDKADRMAREQVLLSAKIVRPDSFFR